MTDINERIARAKGWRPATADDFPHGGGLAGWWIDPGVKGSCVDQPEMPAYLTDPALLWGLFMDLYNRGHAVWYCQLNGKHWVTSVDFAATETETNRPELALCLAWLAVFEKEESPDVPS